jgi:hypothetical protein
MRKNTSRVKQLISRCGGCRKEIKGIVGFSILFKCVKLSNPPELAKIKPAFGRSTLKIRLFFRYRF